MARVCVFSVLIVAIAFVIGCNKETSPTGSTPPPGPTGGDEPTGPYAAGRKVFANHGCARCHAVGDTSGKKRMGPDLAHVAADPTHTKEWLAEFVRDPKAHNPSTKMPVFQGKINDQEMKDLVDYLASLK
jgi:cytochrome c oxidase subunit 2